MTDLHDASPWWLGDLPEPAEDAPRVVSTFSCGGGSSMGYKLAGFRVVGAVDIDPRMTAVYARNFPQTPLLTAGVREILARPDLVEQWRCVDVLDGSPPCTVFSTGGKREQKWGSEQYFAEGAASQVLDRLFFDYLDVVAALRPRMFVAENVKGMLTGNARGYTRKIVETARDLDYDVQVLLLDAAGYGVPQHRERVFFVGRRRDLDLPPIIVPEPARSLPTARDAFAGIEAPGDEARLRGLEVEMWENMPPGADGQRYYAKTRGRQSGFTISKLHPDRPTPTLAAHSRFFHWSERRRITGAEALRLASFPDDYALDVDGKSMGAVYVAGMSVPPKLMRAVATSVRIALASA